MALSRRSLFGWLGAAIAAAKLGPVVAEAVQEKKPTLDEIYLKYRHPPTIAYGTGTYNYRYVYYDTPGKLGQAMRYTGEVNKDDIPVVTWTEEE